MAPNTLACGACVFSEIWFRFPPIASWCLIFPIWMVSLGAVRSKGGFPVRLVPPLPVSILLTVGMLLLWPGSLGPLMGIWIPVSCVAGTITTIRSQDPRAPRRIVSVIAVATTLCLVGFGAWNYSNYFALSAAERISKLPPWSRESASTELGIPYKPEPASQGH